MEMRPRVWRHLPASCAGPGPCDGCTFLPLPLSHGMAAGGMRDAGARRGQGMLQGCCKEPRRAVHREGSASHPSHASFPIPNPSGMPPCPYSHRRGSAGRLSLGSQIFWMRLCVSSMGIFKTKVFLRSASTLMRLREGGGEIKKGREVGEIYDLKKK